MRHQVFTPTFDGDRVAVLGASSVHGSHYLASEAFPAQLQTMLEQATPSIPVRCSIRRGWNHFRWNCTQNHGSRPDIDLLIVYYGHNEGPVYQSNVST